MTEISLKEALQECEGIAGLRFDKVAFRRVPETAKGWSERAAAEFPFWGFVEKILGRNDDELAASIGHDLSANAELAKQLGEIADRWQAGAEFCRLAEIRLLSALTRAIT